MKLQTLTVKLNLSSCYYGDTVVLLDAFVFLHFESLHGQNRI